MTPAQLNALTVGTAVAIVRDDVPFRHRRYVTRIFVSKVAPTTLELTYGRPNKPADPIPRTRLFNRETGRGLKKSSPFWIESMDSLEVMAEIQPSSWATVCSPREILSTARRWPEWGTVEELQELIRWTKFWQKPEVARSPEMKTWCMGEEERLRKALLWHNTVRGHKGLT